MPQGPAHMRSHIATAAYNLACNQGLNALNIRTLAKDCGVSVGTIYNYFPDKAALVTEVIMTFWTTIAFSEETRTCLQYSEGENLIAFCNRLYNTMDQALDQFRTIWLGDVSSLDARTRQKEREAEQACFVHIYQSLEKVILADKGIDQNVLVAIGANNLALLLWDTFYQSLLNKDQSYRTLLALLEHALYR